MTTPGTFRIRIAAVRYCSRAAAIVAVALLSMAVVGHAQTYAVLYNFETGFSGNGSTPYAGVSMDRAGNLYGTTSNGGTGLAGGVFKLSHRGSGWIYTPLYLFSGGSDGGRSTTKVIIGPNGSLYGMTDDGGAYNFGVFFNLQPPLGVCKTVSCPWRETVLHSFNVDDNGAGPVGDPIFDSSGNLYGTLFNGGHNDGVASAQSQQQWLVRNGSVWVCR